MIGAEDRDRDRVDWQFQVRLAARYLSHLSFSIRFKTSCH